MNDFWMVLGRGAPNYRHDTLKSAVTEAERLAKINPGEEFFVLQMIGKVVKNEVEWERTHAWPVQHDIPF